MSAYSFTQRKVTARDGVLLMTRTVFPLGYLPGEKRPAVYRRTPYELPAEQAPFNPTDVKRLYSDFLDRGYIVVTQHCRGTGSSTGVFRNMSCERSDTLDTLDWIRAQTWYNGEIFLYGNSYLSFIHSTVLALNPPDVKGAALAVMPSDQRLCCYEKNTFKHDLYTMWLSKTYMVNDLDTKTVYRRMGEELKKRPLITLAKRVYGFDVPELTEAFVHGQEGDPYWQNPETALGQSYSAPLQTKIPLLLVGGLYDIHFAGTLAYFDALNPEVKKHSAMLIGPWTHSMATLPEHKALFPNSSHPPVEAEWFDWLRGAGELNYVTEGKVTYYRCGSGWIRADRIGAPADGEHTFWPTPDGRLTDTPSEGTLSYDYDPENPLSLPGGASIFQTPLRGPQPQPEPGLRQDLLSFVSAPAERVLRLDGKVRVCLTVSSDCPDTAFFVRVDAVRGGTAWCLRDTIVSLSDCVGAYCPGQKAEIAFELDPVVWDLQPGDALRVDISSSNFPTYNAHANTAEPWYLAGQTRTAHNTLYTEGCSFTFPTVG